MNTFRFSTGIHSFREARMLRMSPFSMPGEQPQPEGPREGDVVHNMRAEQLPEETLRALEEHINMARQQTEETVEAEIARLIETAQRNVDAIAATPGMSRQFIRDYLNEMNANLHPPPRSLHMSMANGQIRVSPYNPTVFPPEVIARKNRINQLQGQINEVDRNIQLLRRDFSQNAVQYRNQKGASMNRRNIAPEVNRFLMQFPQASMQASAGPLNQLYSLKFQLQQELAGVKSGRIKVPVPTAGGEDPSLINDPRFAASALGDSRFNLNGAPGGIGPDGLPLENALPTAAEQAQILRYTARWRNAKTEEERETVEGFLMMDGVDVDGSNLETDDIVMVSPEERGIQFLVGLITVLKSFIDRMGRKRTAIEGADLSEADPSTMTQEERDTETKTNDGKIKNLNEKRGKTEDEIAKTEKKLNDATTPLEGEAKEKAEKELKAMKEELKTIDEEIKKLEERNAALADPTKKPAENGKIKSQDELKDDPLAQEFATSKEALKVEMRESVRKLITSGNMRMVGKLVGLLGVREDDPDMARTLEARMGDVDKMLDAVVDSVALEKNDNNEYRLVIDFMETAQKLENLGIIEKGSAANPSNEELAFLAEALGERDGFSLEGKKVVGRFMDEATARKQLL